MSVANFTHMTIVNLNNSVGRRINEKPLLFDSSLADVVVVVVSVSFEEIAVVSPLMVPLIAAASLVLSATSKIFSSSDSLFVI